MNQDQINIFNLECLLEYTVVLQILIQGNVEIKIVIYSHYREVTDQPIVTTI